MGCPDWPLCHGQLIPPLDDPKAWIEWVHRTVAAVIGFMILGVAFLAWKDHRHQRSILIPSIAAVLLVGFQAWLGRETVRLNNSGESVTAHLAAAMALLGLLVYVTVRAFYPAKIEGRGASQRFTLLAAFSAIATYALLLFGSHVTAQNAGARVPRLAADERRAHPDRPGHRRGRPAAVRGPRAPPLRGGHRGAHHLGDRVGGVADAARPPDARPARAPDRGPVPDPGAHRRAPGPDPARRVDADAPPRARARSSGRSPSALAVAAYYEARTATVPAASVVGAGGTGSGGDERRGRPADAAATPSAPTSR